MTMTDNLLRIKLPDNDSGHNTLGGYLCALLEQLWEQGEGFSGKRPFGNSGWQGELLDMVATACAVDEKDANAIIQQAIENIGSAT